MSFCVYLLEDCNGFGYIGSTCNLKQRLRQHKRNNDCMSKILTQPYSHLVLEEIEDKDNLEFAERFYIKLYKSLWGDKLLNKIIPLQTKKEYYNENRERIKQYKKEYLNENREKIKQQKKEWYIDNKEKIKEHRSQIIDCECGSTIQLQEKARHLKSQKHINFTKQ
jgi:predicted GIY-YIG superfamily endonuclease